MELFTCDGTIFADESAEPRIETPLGMVRLDLALGEVAVTGSALGMVFWLPSGARVLQWRTDAYVAELLLCASLFWYQRAWEKQHSDSAPRQIEGYGAVWRVMALMDTEELALRCGFEPGYTWMDGEDDEDAYSCFLGRVWWDERYRVAIGTRDEICFDELTDVVRVLPTSWVGQIQSKDFTCTLDGVEIHPPRLLANEHCEIQFAVAWEPQEGEPDLTYYAANPVPTFFLDGAGCR